jgi:Domain of unknown function (DUF4333)
VAARLAAVPLHLTALAACADPLPAERVSDAVADAFEAELGFRPVVSCPDDMGAEAGAETRCTAGVEDATYGATVTVTAVDDGGAEFDVQVDRDPADP